MENIKYGKIQENEQISFCLYARKSSESDERQAMSIESQINEMKIMAERENLFIKEIIVNEGVPYKRYRPMSRGRAYPILKRTSHIVITLGIKKGVKIPDISLRKQTDLSQFKDLDKEKKQEPEMETEKRETKDSIKANYNTKKDIVLKPKKQNWAKRIFRRKSI